MVWGCITYYVSFCVGSRNMNNAKYIKVLDTNLWPDIYQIFCPRTVVLSRLQCLIHRSIKTGSKGMTFRLSSGNSRTQILIPIENVWYVVKKAVRKSICSMNTVLDIQHALTPGIHCPKVMSDSENEEAHHQILKWFPVHWNKILFQYSVSLSTTVMQFCGSGGLLSLEYTCTLLYMGNHD